ncbi:MAG: helix-turn-helix transcriptional regulator [Acidobacteria bacterium]|nr:helix-turn-helix transcriptional regulator [Acidobacteriota bacterium]
MPKHARTDPLLRDKRRAAGLTQAQVAGRLGLTQAYVSMLEQGRRAVPATLRNRVAEVYGLGPAALAVSGDASALGSVDVARSLAALGYEPLGYLRARRRLNPAEVLLRALRHPDLESRVAEGLPWLLVHYPDLDWTWLVREAKLADVQNRLGFVVTLARQAAGLQGNAPLAAQLREREDGLDASRLAREDTFCHDSLTQAERRWLRTSRPPEAARWNLLTSLRADELRYAA